MRDEARPPGWRQRLCALALLLCALAGAAATVVVWRADAADRRGDYAGALWWRPTLPLYQRQRAEQLLLTDPAAAETHLQLALGADPYDTLARADLATVELALGRFPRALALTEAATSQQRLDFTARWRLANLHLAQADLPGFWGQFARAAALAPASAYPAMVSRALTASHFDFATLRQALPAGAAPAAGAYLQAALAHADREAVLAGADWLLRLRPTPPGIEAQRSTTLLAALPAVWQRWPGDAAALGARLAAAGVLPRVKSGDAPRLWDGNFDPAADTAARRLSPDPAAPLSAIVGWRWFPVPGLDAQPVETGDAAHPTAADFAFDGTEPSPAVAAEQWFLVPAGARLRLALWTRQLDDRPSAGFSLRLAGLDGATFAELPLTPSEGWQPVSATWNVPGGEGVTVFSLQLAYRRPSGQMALNNHLLLTGIHLEADRDRP